LANNDVGSDGGNDGNDTDTGDDDDGGGDGDDGGGGDGGDGDGFILPRLIDHTEEEDQVINRSKSFTFDLQSCCNYFILI
jgi:hypothetical protein